MHTRLVIRDPFRLDRELLIQTVLVVEPVDEGEPIAGAMLLPDRLCPTPPSGQTFVGVEPIRSAVHESVPVPRDHRLEGFRDAEREDALTEQNGPDELSF